MLRQGDLICREYRVLQVNQATDAGAIYTAKSTRSGGSFLVRQILNIKELPFSKLAELESSVVKGQVVRHKNLQETRHIVKQAKQWFIFEEQPPGQSLEQWFTQSFGSVRFEELLNIPEIYGRVAPSASFVSQKILLAGYRRVVLDTAANIGIRPVDFGAIGLGPTFPVEGELEEKLKEAAALLGLSVPTQARYLEAVAYIYTQLLDVGEFLSAQKDKSVSGGFWIRPENIYLTSNLTVKVRRAFETPDPSRAGCFSIPGFPFSREVQNKLQIHALVYQLLNGYSPFLFTRNPLFQQLQLEYLLSLPSGLLGAFPAADQLNCLVQKYFMLSALKRVSYEQMKQNLSLLSSEVDLSQHSIELSQIRKSISLSDPAGVAGHAVIRPIKLQFCVVGDDGVGKKSLVRILAQQNPVNGRATRKFDGIDIEFVITKDGKVDKPHACIAVFSRQNLASLIHLSQIFETVLHEAPETFIFMVGNDFGGPVQTTEPQLCRFFPVSQLNSCTNLDDILRQIIQELA